MNYGIRQMTGEYAAWLSHDDIFTPDKIEKQIHAALASGLENPVVHSNFEFWDVSKDKHLKVDLLQNYTKEQLEDSCFAPLFCPSMEAQRWCIKVIMNVWDFMIRH